MWSSKFSIYYYAISRFISVIDVSEVVCECPMMYCNALGFIPAFANVVQNVWRKVCGVITFGNATFCVLVYFLTSPRNILS